ncbi:MAG: YdcF family protein [Cyanothece sp. SIO1E1]|nr:YdcF family protein [Cyanothece sp. SIO1E1]
MGPTDAILVLGGSIRREIYAAQLAAQSPETPILISQGSPDPCIWLVFKRATASMQQVWLEKCAQSTFGNFYFSLPVLHRWHVHKVKLVTSQSHLPRAQWLAQILLGAHGIWVEVEVAPEQGVPGNQEAWLKTGLDVARSLAWVPISQVYSPQCADIMPLTQVDINRWRRQGFHCEHQAGIN